MKKHFAFLLIAVFGASLVFGLRWGDRVQTASAAPTSTIVQSLIVRNLGGTGDLCLRVNASGYVSTSTADCGTGGGGTATSSIAGLVDSSFVLRSTSTLGISSTTSPSTIWIGPDQLYYLASNPNEFITATSSVFYVQGFITATSTTFASSTTSVTTTVSGSIRGGGTLNQDRFLFLAMGSNATQSCAGGTSFLLSLSPTGTIGCGTVSAYTTTTVVSGTNINVTQSGQQFTVNATSTPTVTSSTQGSLTSTGTSTLLGDIYLGSGQVIYAGANRFLYTTNNHENLFVGEAAGTLTASGSGNFAGGDLALKDLTTGSNNVALGRGAGFVVNTGSDNFALGTFALFAATSSSFNVGIGRSALASVVKGTAANAGNGNIGIGFSAGNPGSNNITTDERFICLGSNCGKGVSTILSDAGCIGASCRINISNAFNLSYTRVAVGTSTPAKTFHIDSSTSTLYMTNSTASAGATIILEDTDGAGCTGITALNGILTAATVACP